MKLNNNKLLNNLINFKIRLLVQKIKIMQSKKEQVKYLNLYYKNLEELKLNYIILK